MIFDLSNIKAHVNMLLHLTHVSNLKLIWTLLYL